MRRVLEGAALRDASLPVVSNVDATPRTEATAIREALARQITGAVQWESSLRVMAERGVARFVEVGPGAVLCGLIRRTLPDAEAQCAGTSEGIRAVA
jgi:[acyl-carrier-protein] S-malonyltransferase